MKITSITLKEFSDHKWTPRFAYIEHKLKESKSALTLDTFIDHGPINGIDSRKFVAEGTDYVRISDMKRFFISYSDIKKIHISSIPKKVILEDNDILVSRKGTPGIAVLVTQNDLASVIGTEAILLRIKAAYSAEYLVAFMNSKIFYEQIVNNLSGAVSSGINHPTLKRLKILYDNDLAKDIDEKMTQVKRYHEESDQLLEAAKQALYCALNIDFTRVTKTNNFSVSLSTFTKHDLWTPKFSYPKYVELEHAISTCWPYIELARIADIKRGIEPGSANYNKYLDKNRDDIPLIRTSDLINYEVDAFPDFYVPKDLPILDDQDVETGDVLFTKDGKIGMSAIVTASDAAVYASGISRIRLNERGYAEGFTPELLFLLLTLPEVGKNAAKRRTVVASTIPHLAEERLGEIKLPKIDSADILNITDTVKRAFALKDQKKSLLKEIQQQIEDFYL